MNGETNADANDEAAAAWALRLDGACPEQSDDPELKAWLAGDALRAGALLRAQAGLHLVDRLAATQGAAAPTPRAPLTRRGLIAGGGAGLAAAGLGAVLVLQGGAERFTTRRGEIRRVPLADGSTVAINTASTLDVALKRRARQIKLVEGEAFFDVAKDKARPFTVEAGDVRVRAVGTAFAVRRIAGAAEVMVTEGVIEAWLDGRDRPPVRVEAGYRILVDPLVARDGAPAPLEIERALAWRNGEIVLDGQSLAAAAAEFNRYNAAQIVIDDPKLGDVTFIGVFQLNAPGSFAAAVGASLGVRVAERDGRIVLGGQS